VAKIEGGQFAGEETWEWNGGNGGWEQAIDYIADEIRKAIS
jgi:hypothetical protein